MPESRQHILPRKEHTSSLCEALRRYPLVALSSPVGYGKTCLAQEVMAAWEGETVYTTVAPGGEAEFLWQRVCAQIAHSSPTLASLLREVGPPVLPKAGILMADALTRYTRETQLLWVVDDAHYTHSPAMEANLTYLSMAGIPGLRFLLLSRAVPRISMRELQIKGKAVLFRQDFCRFTPGETERLFSLSGIEDKEAAQSAHATCLGWPTGVNLLAQAYLQGAISQKNDA